MANIKKFVGADGLETSLRDAYNKDAQILQSAKDYVDGKDIPTIVSVTELPENPEPNTWYAIREVT